MYIKDITGENQDWYLIASDSSSIQSVSNINNEQHLISVSGYDWGTYYTMQKNYPYLSSSMKISVNTGAEITTIIKNSQWAESPNITDTNILHIHNYQNSNYDTTTTYEYIPDFTNPPAPTATPTGDEVLGADAKITLVCDDKTATIYYTLDGMVPTDYSAAYSGAIIISVSNVPVILKIRAYDPTGNASEITTYTYTFDTTSPSAPIATPNGMGVKYNAKIYVSLSCDDNKAIIRYTLDGSNPTNTSTMYTGPIELYSTDNSITLKSRAYDLANNASEISSNLYTFYTKNNITRKGLGIRASLSMWRINKKKRQ